MGDRDVDWLDQLCEADEKIAELESENAKLRDQLRWRMCEADEKIAELESENAKLRDQLRWRMCEADEKIAELESENAKLRDQLRWRKWPEEKPEETGRNPYTVILGCDCVQATFSSGRWLMDERMSFEDVADMVTHWRPIGPLPGGE